MPETAVLVGLWFVIDRDQSNALSNAQVNQQVAHCSPFWQFDDRLTLRFPGQVLPEAREQLDVYLHKSIQLPRIILQKAAVSKLHPA
jgi:hypothetical protein